jgi:secretion/DNA translocation related CpaE-like protein
MNDVRTVAVLGGGTGAGATTLLVALATRAHAAGRQVGAVDADPCGGGLEVAFGLEAEPGVRWEDLLGSDGPLDGERLVDRLPSAGEGPSVLSFGRQWCTVTDELLDRALDGFRAVHDLLFLDVGRHLLTPEAVAGYDDLILVARGTAAGLAAAGATTQRIERLPRLVVRGAGQAAARDAADALGMDLAAVLPTERRLAADAERGLPAGSRSRSAYVGECDRLLRDLLLPGAAAA